MAKRYLMVSYQPFYCQYFPPDAFQTPDWIKEAGDAGSSPEFPGKCVVHLALGELILLVTPCWKVQSGLISNQSHPDLTRRSRVASG